MNKGYMNEKQTQKSELFQILINLFEKALDKKEAKDKKDEILDLISNSNNLRSNDEMAKIAYELQYSFQKGDIELIKICLNETVEHVSKGFTYKIDRKTQTASLFKTSDYISDITVPRTIEYESAEYLITSIAFTSKRTARINFVKDSGVRTIYKEAISYKDIEEIYIPASLKELKEGWCLDVNYLTKIVVSPFNDQFKYIEDKYLLGKSDENNDEFDVLLFARRDIKEISIPPNIKIITPFAFYNCKDLTKIDIPPDSNLQTIGSDAFSYSKIEEIYFPASLKELKEGWCHHMNYLTKIVVSPLNDQFKYIDDKYLLGKSDQNNNEFDVLLFARRDIEEISIPPNIKIITPFAFFRCKNLAKIEIPRNSNLQTIEGMIFSNLKIEEIFIPPKVTKLGENAFCDCINLKKVKIPHKSNLQSIGECAFANTMIRKICFPASLKELKEKWFYNAKKLRKIAVSPLNNQFVFKEDKYLLGKSDENSDEFDVLLFTRRDIKEISIPPNIKIISSYAFCDRKRLKKVEIPSDSNLQIIEKFAFDRSHVRKIYIPAKVTKICQNAFINCKFLRKVKIPTNSNLQTIEPLAFANTHIKKIFIPPNISKIGDLALSQCKHLTKVEIPKNSKLQKIGKCAFFLSNVEEFYIPDNLKQLEVGWNLCADKICKIEVSPLNDQFVFKEDKYLLGKSDQNNDEFDVLLFARRDIKEISFPPNIKSISLYAFYNCKDLTKIDIPKSFNPQNIECCTFTYTNISKFSIPPNVSIIYDTVFAGCKNLRKVEIPQNSNLQIIEVSAFECSNITSIIIPPSVSKICENAFSNCQNLQIIEITELESIAPGAFNMCPNLIIMSPPKIVTQNLIVGY